MQREKIPTFCASGLVSHSPGDKHVGPITTKSTSNTLSAYVHVVSQGERAERGQGASTPCPQFWDQRKSHVFSTSVQSKFESVVFLLQCPFHLCSSGCNLCVQDGPLKGAVLAQKDTKKREFLGGTEENSVSLIIWDHRFPPDLIFFADMPHMNSSSD